MAVLLFMDWSTTLDEICQPAKEKFNLEEWADLAGLGLFFSGHV
jgi:hypothetical protein